MSAVWKSLSRTSWLLVAIALATGGAARVASAQAGRDLTACTLGASSVCAQIRFIPGPNMFELQLRTLGVTGAPLQPVSLYNLIFGTGAAPAVTPVSSSPVPQSIGGATIPDHSPWDIFDAGDVLFLSSLTNRGVGGCATGVDVDGFGQAGNTCGAGQFMSFSFIPTSLFDPALFQILNFEAVLLTDPSEGVSCGSPGNECTLVSDMVIPTTAVPEPGSLALVLVGVVALAVVARRQRCS